MTDLRDHIESIVTTKIATAILPAVFTTGHDKLAKEAAHEIMDAIGRAAQHPEPLADAGGNSSSQDPQERPSSPQDRSDPQGDVQFIQAALSWYDGGPAAGDVNAAWGRLKVIIHDAQEALEPFARNFIDRGLADDVILEVQRFNVSPMEAAPYPGLRVKDFRRARALFRDGARSGASTLGASEAQHRDDQNPSPDAGGVVDQDALKDAFVAGCVAVAEHFGHPTDDFDEAGYDYAASVASIAPRAEAPADYTPERIKEVVAEGDGLWLTCSGCYEGEDGQNVHGYPHSETFGCIIGSGCGECGGLGAIWDTTDYEAMGRELRAALASRPQASPKVPAISLALGALERIAGGLPEYSRADRWHEAREIASKTIAALRGESGGT